MRTHLPWETLAASVALGAFGYSCTAILGYDEVVFENESAGGGETTGGGPTLDTLCVPAEGSEAPADACGVFVSAAGGSDESGDGSKASPFRTLGKALSKGEVVYACAAATFDEAVEIDGEATLFGGLDCEHGWAFTPEAKTRWTAPAGAVPLRIQEGGRGLLRDVAITARDAEVPSGSSIAVIVGAKATLDLLRCDVVAGDGREGFTPPEQAAKGAPGAPGGKGMIGCVSAEPATLPGLGAQGTCGVVDVSGGSGGPGLASGSGADGSDGSPGIGGAASGDGGKKQDGTACTSGHSGAGGEDGEDGAGAKALGLLSAQGYTGSAGEIGSAGKPGQGGGGGGGARSCTNGKAGPSGGGGGSGACGGVGGLGGRAGGSSIGIVSVNAKLVLAAVNIRVGDGGKGGAGAPGGSGGDGGTGAAGGAGDVKAKACAGGKGGDGGKGGRGGGGRGGHSIGIAHRGAAPPSAGVDIQVGSPGAGGQGDGTAGNGAPGLAEKAQDFE